MIGSRRLLLPLLAAALAAALVLLAVRRVPMSVHRLLSEGIEHPMNVKGGLRTVVRVPGGDGSLLEAVAANLGERARAIVPDARALVRDGAVVLDMPDGTERNVPLVAALVSAGGRLEIKAAVAGSPRMQALAGYAAADSLATTHGVEVMPDRWTGSDGASHEDVYLRARDRAALEAYIAEVGRARPELAIEAGHELGFERIDAVDELDMRGHWRTYYLRSQVALDASSVVDADVGVDSMTGEPQVIVTLDDSGRERFAALTTELVGKKLIILIDGDIVSAPVVMEPITQGRMIIASGGPRMTRGKAEILAAAVRAGPLPAEVAIESSLRVVPRATARAGLVLRVLMALAAGVLVFLVVLVAGRVLRRPAAA